MNYKSPSKSSSVNENEDIMAPRYSGGEVFYCRYKGENKQRHRGDSRAARESCDGLDMASQLNQVMRGEREGGEQERKRRGGGTGKGKEPRAQEKN